MYFFLLWKTKFLDNAIAELLSQKITVPFTYSWHKLLNIFLIQTAWHATAVAATYSVSAVDNATMDCFLEAHEMAPEPMWNT